MDVMKPELFWHNGACYRINSSHETMKEEQSYEYTTEPIITMDDEVENFEFTTLDNGRIKTSFHVSTAYFGYIIGAKGTMVKRIMNETHTDIKIPSRGSRGDVIITGPDVKKVAAAARRINMIVIAARKKQRITHFVSIPMNSEEISNNFNKFKSEILSSNTSPTIEESIFIVPSKLHLTLYVMSLMDNEERTLASEILEEAKNKIVDPLFNGKHLEVKVSGISYMNDDPKNIHVLYAEIVEHNEDDRGILHKLVEGISDLYARNGFEVSKPSTKLHVTLMNTFNRTGYEDNMHIMQRIAFDGTNILQKYKDFDFGKQIIKDIYLCHCGAGDQSGHYRTTYKISI